MEFCDYEPRKFFLFGMRVFFGIWLLYAGLSKWLIMGPEAFVGYITGDFDKTWSPHMLNVALAWLIIVAEPVGAIWILSGKMARMAWGCAALLMYLLMFGQSILMHDASNNWHYVVLTLACAALCDPEVAVSTSKKKK